MGRAESLEIYVYVCPEEDSAKLNFVAPILMNFEALLKTSD